MTPADRLALLDKARRAASAVYLAAEAGPAADISDIITRLANELERVVSPTDPLREPSPQPCTDVHRVVNGVCENCGMRFPSERALEAAMDVFRANPAVWVNRDDDWLEQALVAAYKVDGLGAPAPSGVPRELVDDLRPVLAAAERIQGVDGTLLLRGAIDRLQAALRAALQDSRPFQYHEIRLDSAGELDDIVLQCDGMHLEHMRDGAWFVAAYRGGAATSFWLSTSRDAPISISMQENGLNAPEVPYPGSGAASPPEGAEK